MGESVSKVKHAKWQPTGPIRGLLKTHQKTECSAFETQNA